MVAARCWLRIHDLKETEDWNNNSPQPTNQGTNVQKPRKKIFYANDRGLMLLTEIVP